MIPAPIICPYCGGQAFKLTGTEAAYWCLNPMCGKLFVLTEPLRQRVIMMRAAWDRVEEAMKRWRTPSKYYESKHRARR